MTQNNKLVLLYYKEGNYNMQEYIDEANYFWCTYAHIRRIKKAIVHYVPTENHNEGM